MLAEIRTPATKMTFMVFRNRVSALAEEIKRAGGSASVVFAGPDEEVDNISRTKTQIWRATLEITGPLTQEQLNELEKQVIHDSDIGAKQGIMKNFRSRY